MESSLSYVQIIHRILYKLLGDRLDYLGYYEYYQGKEKVFEDRAIQINWHDLSMKPHFKTHESGGGMECTIESVPDTNVIKHSFGTIHKDVYEVQLAQHNDKKFDELVFAVRAIYAHQYFNVVEQPIIRPRQYINEGSLSNTVAGEIPARATVYLQLSKFVSKG